MAILRPLILAALLPAIPAMAQDAGDLARRGTEAAEAFPGFANLCDLDQRMRDVNAPRDRSAKRGERPQRQPRETPGLPPMQVFDDLYFLGTGSVSAWLYGDDDGYVLIDTLNTAEEAEEYVLGGMRSLGLDPADIRAILITHAHGDHYGGATYLSQKLGVDVMMSEADWRLAERTPPHPRFGAAPERGISVRDGQVLRFGDHELRVLLTPGHTPGTVSPIFALHDGGREHMAILWGGSGFNFGPDVMIFEEYAASAARARDEARAAGVDVFLSNHVRRDGADKTMEALRTRPEGAPNPFVRGDEGYALFDVLESCALAQAARFADVSADDR